jgi:D-alanyl-D-alanine carboxypeptidase (penicillin-binding protein 5/6)
MIAQGAAKRRPGYKVGNLNEALKERNISHVEQFMTQKIHRTAFFCIVTTIVTFNGLVQSSHAAETKEKKSLADVLGPAIKAHRGDVAIAVKHLKTGETFEHNAEEVMPTASLIKFPVMITAYDAVEKGKLDLKEMIELKKEDQVPGSGILTSHFSPGAKISLRDAIHLMIVYSDNTATNLVLDKIGLPATKDLMASLGYPETRINSKVFRRDTSIDPERSNKYSLGSTTARDMVKLAEQLYNKKLVSENASQKMLDHLFACEDKIKVPRKLPPGTRVAHKTGSVNLTRTDAGVMETPSGPIAFCILTNNNQDQRWTDDNEGDLFCAEVGAAIYQYFNIKGDVPAPVARTLQMGADGELVLALQRTLNARLKDSNIGTDGDFGPETEGAVKKLQTQEGLKSTGIVDADTWKALGPLIMEDKPAPEPEVVNAEPSKKEPADSLDGPPFVTAKAWAIVDGNTGEFLAGDNEDEKRDPASTTKIMTGYLVTELAENDPKVLEEVVIFSERADRTSGSTSDVKAGEKLPVGELLYGLMLPSGNDASVSFAEHFGERLADPKEAGGDSVNAYDSFIAAMNHKAEQIGMKSTRFNNPHGLPSEGHQTTARDLAVLAYEAYKLPSFRKLVATPQHGYTLDSVTGYKRNIVWRNTNQLLRTDGYDGIKTGTTGAAGSCLVSTAERESHRLIIAVLGSTSTDARYTDTRNLYRWAWRDLVKLKGEDKATDSVLKAN